MRIVFQVIGTDQVEGPTLRYVDFELVADTLIWEGRTTFFSWYFEICLLLQTPSSERVAQLVMFGVLRQLTSMMTGPLISCGPDSAENGWTAGIIHSVDDTGIIYLNVTSAGLTLDPFHFAVYIWLNISGIRGDCSGSVSRNDSHPDSRIWQQTIIH